MADQAQSNRANALDAKLYQGHDPNSEFKEQGNLLSSVPYSDSAQKHTGVIEEIFQTAARALENLIEPGNGTAGGGNVSLPESHSAFTNSVTENSTVINNSSPLAADDENFSPSPVAGGGFGDVQINNLGINSQPVGGGDGINNGARTQSAVASPAPESGSGSGSGDNAATPAIATIDPSDLSGPHNPGGNNGNGSSDLTTPVVMTSPAQGAENQPTSLAIQITTDPDATSSQITISNVPSGGVFSAGTNNGDGSWSFTPVQLTGLTFTPPLYASGMYTFTVTAISSDASGSASASNTLAVDIEGVATAPTVTTQPASGNENTAIALTVNAALVDTDGSETLSLTISGLPAGAVLSAGHDNGNGSWTLTPAQLSGLSFTPPLNASGDYTLTVAATSSENGTTATTSASLMVNVEGVATPPTLSVQAATGNEDTAIALTINAALVDNDGSETLAILVGNVPVGGMLSAGHNNGNGTWTLTPGQLSGLTFTPPMNASGTYDLTVTATSSENGTTANTSSLLHVTVSGVADAPILSTPPVTGNEDSAIALTINANLADQDGSETLSVTISGIPAGGSLSAGHDNGNGSWTLTPAQLSGLTFTPPHDASGTYNFDVAATASENGTTASSTSSLVVTVHGAADAPTLSVQAATGNEDNAIALTINAALTDMDGSESLSIVISDVPAGSSFSAGTNTGNGVWVLTAAQLQGLTFTPPLHASGEFHLNVMAVSSEDGSMAMSQAQLVVDVTGVAIAPSLSVQAAAGNEDTAIGLTINAALLVNDGSETLSILIGDVPNGATLSAGINNGDGTWTLTAAQLSGLTFTPPANASGSYSLSVIAIAEQNGHWAMTTHELPVTVNGVADAPSLSVQAATGNEDSLIALTINAALTDTDGSETMSVLISGIPAGGSLSAGHDNGNGSWTLTEAQLSGLNFIPPQHASGSYTLTIAATASENGTDATTTTTLGVTVDGVATPPSLSVQAASGNEDTSIALTINAALVDNDGSETLSVLISGVPAGGTLSAGINNGNGSWTLTPAQLSGLIFTPPANASGDYALTVTAISSENATTAQTVATLPVHVTGVADMPTLAVQTAAGLEDHAIPLVIASALADVDGSEHLSILIGNVPDGAILSAGLYTGNGHWSLSSTDLVGLTLTPPENFSGTINLSVTAIATEQAGGDTAVSATATLQVVVAPVPDLPDLHVGAAIGLEDQFIPLNIQASIADSADTLSVTISNIPNGAILSAGHDNGNGSWTLTGAQLIGLSIKPPLNSSADFVLDVAATSTIGGASDTVHASLGVTVAGVADIPAIATLSVTTPINTNAPLSISGGLSDTDGSENLTYLISGIPDGFALNHGVNNGNNSWTLTPAQLSGLQLISPYHFEGELHLIAQSVSHEADGDTALSVPANFTIGIGNVLTGLQIDLGAGIGVGVGGVSQTVGTNVGVGIGANLGGLLSPYGIVIMEDTSIKLVDAPGLLGTLSPFLQSQVSDIKIGGLPTGVTLSHGTVSGTGTYTLTPADLTNLYLISAPNSDQDFTLTIQAEFLSLAAVTLNTTVVHVIGVADVPTLSVATVTGTEDSPIAITINAALTDMDGSETLSLMIKDLPAGFSLNHGINNGNGTWSLTPGQLSGLQIIPAKDFSGDVTYTVVAVSTEREGDTSINTVTGHLHINGVADAPLIAATNLHGTEGQAIALNLGIALSDTDGSEHLSAITISGLPSGFTLTHATDNHDGSWSIAATDLGTVQLVPPSHWSGDAVFSVSVSSQENSGGPVATTNATIPLHIDAHADIPMAAAHDVSGAAGSTIALDLSSSLVDTDGSEHLSIVISGVPDGSVLSHGLNNHDGTWTVSGNDVAHVSITPPASFSGDLHLSMTAYAQESSNGDTAHSAAQNFAVHVDAPPQAMMAMNMMMSGGFFDSGLANDAHSAPPVAVMAEVGAPPPEPHAYDHAFGGHTQAA